MSDVLVVSDFNAQFVSRFLAADKTPPALSVETSPFGQLFQALAAERLDSGRTTLFVWTRPEGVVSDFSPVDEVDAVVMSRILDAVDAFADLIVRAGSRYRTVLVATWVRTEGGRGAGLLEWSDIGRARMLARMNLRLAERLDGMANIKLLDAQQWLDAARPARDSRYWYAMKFPFSDGVAQAAARDVKAAVRAFGGYARKLIVLDLDDTLWGGVVGETGWQGVRVGGHDPIGEAYVDFQKTLKRLSSLGIALGIVSKNAESVALEAFDHHPEMILRRSDLAGWRINWQDKATNLIELVQDLNLGLQSVVFIDDNPAERGRIAETFPDVLVPDWPTDPMRFADALRNLDCFDQPSLTTEDLSRTKMYVQERERGESLRAAGSTESWLAGLGVRVAAEPIHGVNLPRVVQLANKTNQLNLRTRRFTEAELIHWLAERQGRQAFAIRVADRFGELGLTGMISWERTADSLEIVDFILSCRAMGRQVENLLTYMAVEAARSCDARSVIAQLLPTKRNVPCRDFWEQQSGFEEVQENLFTWDTGKPYPKPAFVTLDTPSPEIVVE